MSAGAGTRKRKPKAQPVPEASTPLLDDAEGRRVHKTQRKASGDIVAFRFWVNNPALGDELGAPLGFSYKPPRGEQDSYNRFTGGTTRKTDEEAAGGQPHRWVIRSCGRIQVYGQQAWVGVRTGSPVIFLAMQGRVTRIGHITLGEYEAPDVGVLKAPKAVPGQFAKRAAKRTAGSILKGSEHYPELVTWCQQVADMVEQAYAAKATIATKYREMYRNRLKTFLEAHCERVRVEQDINRVPMDYCRAAYGPNATIRLLYPRCPTVQHALYISAVSCMDDNHASELVQIAGLCEYNIPTPGPLASRAMVSEMRTHAYTVNTSLQLHKGAAGWEAGCLHELLMRRAAALAG